MSDQIQTVIDWLSGAPLRIIAVLTGAVIAQSLGHRAITRAVNRLATVDLRPGPGTANRQAERARTIGLTTNPHHIFDSTNRSTGG